MAAVWTDEQVLNQLVSGYKWSGSTITYSFPTSSSGLYGSSTDKSGFSALTPEGQAAARLALSLWDDLIVSDFQEVTPGTTYTSSNLEFGMTSTTNSYAYAYFPTVGSVWFNSDYSSGGNNLVSPTIGRHGFLTYMHEIGHAIGLDHMGDYNGSQTSGPSSYQDSTVYSIMSYYGPSWGNSISAGLGEVAWADWVGSDGRLYSPQTPMLNDVMAIQSIYGVETTTRTGDTVYGFNSNIAGDSSKIFDFTINKNPIICIFDSSGNDTLDLSGWSTNSVINLAPGSFSSVNSMTYNISIAYTCTIENAIGGSGNDIITGNNVNNLLNGGLGNDTIYGGLGIDTVVLSYSFNAASYTYDAVTDSFIFTNSTYGTDTVYEVEYFLFSDGLKTINDLLNITPLPEVSVSASTLLIDEGNDGYQTVTFTLNGGSDVAGLSGTWNISGISQNDLAASESMSGTFTFDSSGDAVVSVRIAGDTEYEADEIMKISFSSSDVSFGTNSSLNVTIKNDDAAPPPPLNVINGTSSRDTLNGTSQGDEIFGNAGNDRIYGNGGDDVLHGGTGGDLLVGGAGRDFLYGDAGNDLFDFNNVSESSYANGIDVIGDFEVGIDRIDLSTIDSNPNIRRDQAFFFTGESASSYSVWYETYSGPEGSGIMIMADTNGNALNAEFELIVLNVNSISSGSFIL